MITAVVTGRLTRDPEVRTVGNHGRKMLSMSVASDRGRKDA
jgi:single-stranded DNA-binding protein